MKSIAIAIVCLCLVGLVGCGQSQPGTQDNAKEEQAPKKKVTNQNIMGDGKNPRAKPGDSVGGL